MEDFDGENFIFGASSLIQTPLLASKHQYRKKNKMKVVYEILNPISNFAPMDSSMNILQIPSNSMQPNHARGKKNVSNTGDDTNTSLEFKKESIISDPERVAEQEACEKWRLGYLYLFSFINSVHFHIFCKVQGAAPVTVYL